MRKTTITGQKGGIGKTTTAVNLSVALGLSKKSVFLINLAPQQNSTSHFGINVITGIEDFLREVW